MEYLYKNIYNIGINKTLKKIDCININNSIKKYYKGKIYNYILNNKNKAKYYYNNTVNDILTDNDKIDTLNKIKILHNIRTFYNSIENNNNLNNIIVKYEREIIENNKNNKLNDDINTNNDNIKNTKYDNIISKYDIIKKINIYNDPQNVHDANINDQATDRYNKIIEKNGKINNMNSIDDLKNLIKDHYMYVNDKQNIDNIINEISKKKEHYIIKYNDTIDNIIKNIITRIKSPDNYNNKNNLIHNLIINIKDCSDNGYISCSHGIATKLLSTFDLNDSDNNISNPLKNDTFIRQTIFDDTNAKFNELVYNDKRSKELYKKNNLTKTEEEELNNINKKNIDIIKKYLMDKYIDNNKNNNNKNIEDYINEAIAGLEL